MNRSELIQKISRETGIDRKMVEIICIKLFDTIIASLQDGEKVSITGFGRFEMRMNRRCHFVNPNTGVKSELQPHRVPAFSPSQLIKKPSEKMPAHQEQNTR